jgi:hypothetical protein
MISSRARSISSRNTGSFAASTKIARRAWVRARSLSLSSVSSRPTSWANASIVGVRVSIARRVQIAVSRAVAAVDLLERRVHHLSAALPDLVRITLGGG